MADKLEGLTQQLLDAAKKAGAGAADAIAVSGTSVSVDVLHGKLEHAERSEGVEIGLRVLVGQKQACVSASDTRDETIRTMAERAVAMARLAPDDPYAALADPLQLATQLDSSGLELSDPSGLPDPALLEEMAKTTEASALGVNGVDQVQSTSAGASQSSIWLAGSNGFSAGYARSGHSVSCSAISGSGTQMERDYAFETRVYHADLPSPGSIGREAGERAAARAGSRKPKSGTFPVLFDERISSSLIGHLMAVTNGASVARGSSWAINLLGKPVLPDGIDLIEDPHRPRVSGSKLFDGEGLPTAKRDIVLDGVLQSWTLDLATARKLGMTSTANAARGTGAPPSPSAGNLYLTHGPQTRDQLLADMGTGLWVTSMIGSTISPTTGDYSRGASGFWVENGEVQYPVNECTIAGNLIDMLRRIVPANDGQKHQSRVVPSLLVDGMVLAGN